MLETQLAVANRDIYLYNNIASETVSGPVGYDDWAFSLLPVNPTDAQMLVYYTTKYQGPYPTADLAAVPLGKFYHTLYAANGYQPPSSTTAPGGNCAGIYYQAGTAPGYYVWVKPTTAKRLEYIATFLP